jgi:hypothetical protein
MNFSTFSNDISCFLQILNPVAWWPDTNISLVFSALSPRPPFLLASDRASAFLWYSCFRPVNQSTLSSSLFLYKNIWNFRTAFLLVQHPLLVKAKNRRISRVSESTIGCLLLESIKTKIKGASSFKTQFYDYKQWKMLTWILKLWFLR